MPVTTTRTDAQNAAYLLRPIAYKRMVRISEIADCIGISTWTVRRQLKAMNAAVATTPGGMVLVPIDTARRLAADHVRLRGM